MSQEGTKLSASISATCLLSAGYRPPNFSFSVMKLLTVIRFRERNLGDCREGRKGRRLLGEKAYTWQMCWRRPRLTREQEGARVQGADACLATWCFYNAHLRGRQCAQRRAGHPRPTTVPSSTLCGLLATSGRTTDLCAPRLWATRSGRSGRS